MTIRHDLHIPQGTDWSYVYAHVDSAGNAVDLTGYGARATFRLGYGGAVLAHLSDGSDASGGQIAITGASGLVTFSMTAAQSAAILENGIRSLTANLVEPVRPYLLGLYQLELIAPAGTVSRPLQGNVLIDREVTV